MTLPPMEYVWLGTQMHLGFLLTSAIGLSLVSMFVIRRLVEEMAAGRDLKGIALIAIALLATHGLVGLIFVASTHEAASLAEAAANPSSDVYLSGRNHVVISTPQPPETEVVLGREITVESDPKRYWITRRGAGILEEWLSERGRLPSRSALASALSEK